MKSLKNQGKSSTVLRGDRCKGPEAGARRALEDRLPAARGERQDQLAVKGCDPRGMWSRQVAI